MKRWLSLFLIAIVVLTTIGCQSKQMIDVAAEQKVFVQEKDSLTNGSLVYHRLPKNWYYSGDFPYQIGSVKGGKALLSADTNGTIVKEKAMLLASMDNAPWILETVQMPDLFGDDINIVVSIQNQGKVVLSEQAHREFLSWYQKYKDGTISKTVGADLKDKPFISVRFACTSIPGLQYDCNLRIKTKAYTVFVVDDSGAIIGSFDENTQVYREVSGALLEHSVEAVCHRDGSLDTLNTNRPPVFERRTMAECLK